MTIESAKLSPSLNQEGAAVFTNVAGNKASLMAAFFPASKTAMVLPAFEVEEGSVSQVTALKNSDKAIDEDGNKIPLLALISLNAAGQVVQFEAPAAVKVNGKFGSTVQTGTGASQNIAHGLGVVPSLVLASIYDSNGVALPFVMSEGAHDATNLKMTVTSGVKFKIIAFK